MKTICCFLLCSAQNPSSHGPALRWYVSPLPHIPLAHPALSPTSPTAPFFPVISPLHSSISCFPLEMAAVSLCQASILLFCLLGCLLRNVHLPSKDKPRLPLQSYRTKHNRDPHISLPAAATATKTTTRATRVTMLLSGDLTGMFP